jgi:hypothetical protein
MYLRAPYCTLRRLVFHSDRTGHVRKLTHFPASIVSAGVALLTCAALVGVMEHELGNYRDFDLGDGRLYQYVRDDHTQMGVVLSRLYRAPEGEFSVIVIGGSTARESIIDNAWSEQQLSTLVHQPAKIYKLTSAGQGMTGALVLSDALPKRLKGTLLLPMSVSRAWGRLELSEWYPNQYLPASAASIDRVITSLGAEPRNEHLPWLHAMYHRPWLRRLLRGRERKVFVYKEHVYLNHGPMKTGKATALGALPTGEGLSAALKRQLVMIRAIRKRAQASGLEFVISIEPRYTSWDERMADQEPATRVLFDHFLDELQEIAPVLNVPEAITTPSDLFSDDAHFRDEAAMRNHTRVLLAMLVAHRDSLCAAGMKERGPLSCVHVGRATSRGTNIEWKPPE